MVQSLSRYWGWDKTALMLNAELTTMQSWITGKSLPMGVSIRSIWFLHSLTFHPENVSSMFHVLTWGKWARKDEARRRRAKATFEHGEGI